MIELLSIAFKNLLSYGDYVTELELSSLGPCLITGEVVQEHVHHRDKTNGAGKSNIPNVILWTLFGRTMHEPQPGADVLNWFTNGDAWAELRFKNGDRIARTRTRQGRTELLLVRDGNEEVLTADTLATTKIQQQQLSQELGLDWEIFCGSVFFNQYGRPWMEMPDQTRRQALERLLHVDRYTLYGTVAGEKFVAVDQKRALSRKRLDEASKESGQIQIDLRDLAEVQTTFEMDRERRRTEALAEAFAAETEATTLQPLPDLDRLAKEWGLIAKLREIVSSTQTEAGRLRREAIELRDHAVSQRRQVDDLMARRRKWEQSTGKVCLECEQEIQHTHTDKKIAEFSNKLREAVVELKRLEAEAAEVRKRAEAKDSEATSLEHKISQRTPIMTLPEAQFVHKEWNRHTRDADRSRKRAVQIAEETDHSMITAEREKRRLEKLHSEINSLQTEIQHLDIQGEHYDYLKRAYSDRRKVKRHVFSQHVPFINARLDYYLDVFDLDVRIKFNESLGIDNSKWKYTYFSGGERKRTDVALMFAMFDLHLEIYGRQCNIMVLDEVDGKLDGDGIESLIQVINNDLVGNVETILIISHRQHMHGVFPKQVHVRRLDRFSMLEEAR